MRRFSSYGPVNKRLHYYVPRTALINRAHARLTGDVPDEGGHYITVWAPRQTGKSFAMLEVVDKIKKNEPEKYDVAILTMEFARELNEIEDIQKVFLRQLGGYLDRETPDIGTWRELPEVFTKNYLSKPLVLILDEFDSLGEKHIDAFASMFRSIYTSRRNEQDRKSHEKTYLLHGLALVGVRSVLGIENLKGSPFNVQRSLRVPNLTKDETASLFQWYEKESGRKVDIEVVESVQRETRGQPGLVCWLAELLTETYDDGTDKPISMKRFNEVFRMAVQALPNNNVLNMIGKAKQEPYRQVVLDLFKTDRKMIFKYDKTNLNYLYMNGVTDIEETPENLYVMFSSPFVQKRLFNYFSDELFEDTGKLYEPFEDLGEIFPARESLNVANLMRRFQSYLKKNRNWLLKGAPRRKDMRIFEAVYHFNLYRYLCDFLEPRQARVWPEFPTGNGNIDIMIEYSDSIYAVEVKSYTDEAGYREALKQAARYGKQLKLSEITLVFFVEYIDDENREKFETDYTDGKNAVRVTPVFVETES